MYLKRRYWLVRTDTAEFMGMRLYLIGEGKMFINKKAVL